MSDTKGDIPKLKKFAEKAKITLYFDKEIAELYRIGKSNGWDVCQIMREAASDAMRKHQDKIMSEAESA